MEFLTGLVIFGLVIYLLPWILAGIMMTFGVLAGIFVLVIKLLLPKT